MLAFMHQADFIKAVSVDTKEVKPEVRDELMQKNIPVILAHLSCIDP